MRKIFYCCLALGVSAVFGASAVLAAPAAVIPGPPLPPAHVTGRVIDPHAPSHPLPVHRAAPQGKAVQYSEPVPSTSRPVPEAEAAARSAQPSPARPDATSPASYEGAAPQGRPLPQQAAGQGRANGQPAAQTGAGQAGTAASSSPTSAGMPPASVPAQAGSPSLEMQAYTAWQQQNFTEAQRIWELMAASGHGGAMNNLGILWDKGQGVQEDAARAAQWFCKSAEAGHPGGMNNYARMLEQGRGVKKQTAKAAQWFTKAAQAGLPEAQFNVGVLYERGAGVKKNMKTAAQWYGRAAAAQQVEAQSRLARMYSEGRGVKKDMARAVSLAYGAAMAGDTDSINVLLSLAKRGPKRPPADFFGLPLASTDRPAMRKALAGAHVTPLRENDGYMCDVYNSADSVSGSKEMAVCYAVGAKQPLAFVKLDYSVADRAAADSIRDMTAGRYGQPSAGAGTDAALWNLGDVVVATQYVPAEHTVSLMFMVPRVYHLTQQ